MKHYICLLLISLTLLQCKNTPEPLFTSIQSNVSGIGFANVITSSDSTSVLDSEYLYNGGGVAVGDVNNDGLLDLYFTGNMVSSRLYLNKGNLKFEDVTEKANVGTTTWANGASMVDINQDGFTDIYVCVGGTRKTLEKDRANLLFINKGDGTFTESAKQYGLADSGYGIHSTFFDYDRDGDVDMYLLRNSFVNYHRNRSKPKIVNGEAASTDKLFRNNGDLTFTDVSREAGILIEGFGLGVAVSDLNDDGWPDVYAANDFITNDLMYINNQDGTFTNRAAQYLKHQTFNSMGTDISDYNNDGMVDIVVVDMLPEDNKRWKLTSRGNTYDEFQNGINNGYEHQYIRNTLQLNNGNGSFSEVGQIAGIEATEWSWSSLFADYDNDGLKDLFISNGYRQDIINLDFVVYGDKEQTMGQLPEADDKARRALLSELPGIKVHNYMYKNKGDLTFSDESYSWGMGLPTYSNGAAYADLDNDGDLDIVTNNIDEEASLWESHLSQLPTTQKPNYLRISLAGPQSNRGGLGTSVRLKNDGTLQHQYFSPYRGYLSTVEPFLHFGLGTSVDVDSVEVVWPDGKYQLIKNVNTNQVLKVDYAQASVRSTKDEATPVTLFTAADSSWNLNYTHVEEMFVDFKLQPTLPHMHSRGGPGVAVGDINGDRKEDFYIGGADGSPGAMFVQSGDGRFEKKLIIKKDSLTEQTGVLLFDADNDNDLDLYAVSGGAEKEKESERYQDHLYLNDGHGTFAIAKDALPQIRQSGSCVVAGDYDRDGDLDLFVGGRIIPKEYPMPAGSFLLRNDSKDGICKFTNITAAVGDLSDIGLVCSALWSDYDNDGWLDLIVVGEFMRVTFFHNDKGILTNATDDTGLEHTSGWWNSLAAGDFDADGDTDYVAGNQGLNSHFHATADEPLCIYASDYNKDGRIDPVMSYYVQGQKYVGHSRDNLIDQINSIRGRFRTYTDYANATFEQTFLPEEIDEAYMICSDRFESSYIENLGKGKFRISALPLVAQISTVYGMVTGDYDDDGHLDVLLVGNSYAPEISSGRDDASIGLFLKGDGKGNFKPIDVLKTGFFADRDAKGFATLRLSDGRELMIIANNDGAMQTYVTRDASNYYSALPGDAYALITLKDGRQRKHEFYFGSTYLSNSSRGVKIPADVKDIVVFGADGKSRQVNASQLSN
jgi:enediyne biosynthesis protein E4